MSNQPNEAAQRYSPCREKSETLVGGVVTTMKPNDQGNWVRYSLLRKAEAEISSLRSALANAEKQIEEHERWSTQHGAAYQQVADARDAALAKLAEAERALLVIGERAVCDFDDATVGDVDRVVTDHMKYKDWLRSVMTAASERDRLAAQLAEAERDCAGYKERIHELSDELGACEKERDEATECLRLTRGELDAIKNTPQANEGTNICGHDRYWLSGYGRCMACERDQVLSKLAAAKKDAAAWKESSRAWQEQASVIHLERDRLECDALRSALANAEKERDEFAEKVGELAFIRHNLTKERDALAAQLAEATGLLGEALPWVIRLLNHADPDCPICGGHAAPESSGHRKSCTVRRMSDFLAPPSDRGADTQASGRAVPRETIERLGLQRYYDAPSDRGSEGEDGEITSWSDSGKRVSVYRCGLAVATDDASGGSVTQCLSFREVHNALSAPSASAPVEVTGAWIGTGTPPKHRDSVWCATVREGLPTVIEGRHDHHGWWLLHDGCAYSFGEYDYAQPTHWQEIRAPAHPAALTAALKGKP